MWATTCSRRVVRVKIIGVMGIGASAGGSRDPSVGRLWHKFYTFEVMFRWLHKMLFVVVSLSFFISVTEMNIGEAENTFFDEYDTYVKTEQVYSIRRSVNIRFIISLS
jgi:hypothetical protein